MDYKAVFFDLDGTLLDSVPTIIECTRETLESMDIYIDDFTIRHAIGIPLKVQAHRFAPGQEEKFIEDYRKIYVPHVEEDTHLFPGTMKMLAKLREDGRLTGVVTSKNMRGTMRAMEMTGLASLLDCIITADDCDRYKPDPQPIQKAMEKVGVTPEEALYVGDASFDIDMAQRAGVQIVAVSWGARTHEELELICPDGIVDNWDEFLRLLA